MGAKGFTYTLDINAEITDVQKKLSTLSNSMEGAFGPKQTAKIDKSFAGIEKALTHLQEKANAPISSGAAFDSMLRDSSNIETRLKGLIGVLDKVSEASKSERFKMMPPEMQKQITAITSAQNNYAESLVKAEQKSEKLITKEKEQARVQKDITDLNNKMAKNSAIQKNAENSAKAIGEEIAKMQSRTRAIGTEEQAIERVTAARKAMQDAMSQGESRAFAMMTSGFGDAQRELDELHSLTRAIEEKKEAQQLALNTAEKYEKTLAGQGLQMDGLQKHYAGLTKEVDKLNEEFEEDSTQKKTEALRKLVQEAKNIDGALDGITLDGSEESVQALLTRLQQLEEDGYESVAVAAQQYTTQCQELIEANKKVAESTREGKEEFQQQNEAASNREAFLSRIKDFVGMAGAAQLLRTTLQNAFTTIKELDAAMTEMAVVTDLDVGDYWSRLPEYTERANSLGISIKSAYEAATLFYQQGLKTNEVVAISNETLKMARIAGLSAEDATNKMTAALRGFNMELNETSAQRISDVYSELAAITASDVDEISSAMTKTASIASSAGMEFETTAAFLSQIIETTRESAETAGTALKTVIARFQELKKDPSEIGEVDGEVIDANKIETALRSVGVALRDTSGQFRELDDVFLELASKWDGLDTNTQRYIATIAAGSRQQSRFIAMMSDYGRTQELVEAANNSAGASNEQFEKTLDSLESKLNKLKNSWDTFTMSLMNNKVLKVGVEILVKLMDAINGVIELFDKIGLGSVASLGMVVGALTLGTKAINLFELNLRKVNADGTKTYTVLGSIGAVGKTAFGSIVKTVKKIPKELTKVGVAAKASAKGLSKMHSPDFSQSQKRYNNLLDQEQRLNQARLSAEQKIAKGKGNTAQLTQHLAATEGMSEKITQKRVLTEGMLYAAMELTDEERTEAIAMTSAGVKADTAAILAKYGVTAATIKEAAETENLTEEQVAEQMASKLTQKATLQETVSKLLNAAAKKLGAKATVEETKATGGSTLAVWLQTAANWALNASLGVILLVILAVVAAIALLVAAIFLIIAAVKKAIANSPEGKLKSAKEAAEAAGTAADEAAESYNKLSDAFESLSDKYKALEDLTRGSREWRDAIREINGEVVDLVDQYPELANLVTNDDGVLKIDLDSEEAQAVLDKYDKTATLANSAELAAKMQVNKAQTAVDYKNLSNEAALGSQSGIIGQYIGAGALATLGTSLGIAGAGLVAGSAAWIASIEEQKKANKENTDAMAKALADGLVVQEENGDWQVTNGSEEALKELGLTAEQVKEFGKELGDGADELRKYGEQMRAREAQEEALYQAAAANAISLIDMDRKSETSKNRIETAASAGYMKSFEEEALKEIENEIGTADKNDKAWITEQAKKIYGTDEIEVDNSGNVTIGTGDEAKEVTFEQFKNQLALANATEESAKALNILPKAVNSLSKTLEKGAKGAGKALEAMYAGKDGSAMTAQDIEAAKAITDQNLTDAWNALDNAEKEAYQSKEAFIKEFEEMRTAAEKALAQTTELSTKAGIKVVQGVSMEAARGYAEQMYDVYLLNKGNAQALEQSFNKVTAGLSEAEKSEFLGQLNAIDWQNATELDNLPKTLEAIGIAVPETELNTYIKLLKESAGAIEKIDLQKLKDSISSLTNIKVSIDSGEQGKIFSEENYKTLIDMNPELAKEFQLALNGEYIYLGSKMDVLREAIDENTAAQITKTADYLDGQIALGTLLDNSTFMIDGEAQKWGDNEYWTPDEQASFLKQIQDEAKARGMKIEGVDGFDTNSIIPIDDPEKLRSIFDQLNSIVNNIDTNKAKKNNELVSSAALEYQSNSAVVNSLSSYQGKDKYEDLLSSEKNEFDARYRAITTEANQLGVDKNLLENYENAVKEYKEGKIQFQELLAYQQEVANSANWKKTNLELEKMFTKLGDINERWKLLSEGDEVGRIELANEALKDFGITVNNATTADQYLQLLDKVSEGNTEAIQEFVGYATQAAFGAGNAFTDNWQNLTAEQLAFLDTMEKNGLGMWEQTAEGARKFVWKTSAEFQSVAEKAGTAMEEWENPYTWLYNYNEEINNLIRQREKLERKYTKALEDEKSSMQDIAKISADQLNNLKSQASMQSLAIARAYDDIEASFDKNKKFEKYARYDATTNSMTVDYGALEKDRQEGRIDADMGAEFEAFLAEIEASRDTILDAQDTLDDIEDQVTEIENRGRDEMSELYDKVKEGLIATRQKEIDKLSAINDSIQEAQSSLVNKMQEQIDSDRQARENARTEQEIGDKEARLAYLMSDTSGANALEIASLQQEIQEAKQGYTDSLIDQSLQNLQDANAKAAEQRQQQIELMQIQLDHYANSEEVWVETKDILTKSLDAATQSADFNAAWFNTEAAHYIDEVENIKALNPIQSEITAQEQATQAKLAAIYNDGSVAQDASAINAQIAEQKTEIDKISKQIGVEGNTNIPSGLSSIVTEGSNNTQAITDLLNNQGGTVDNPTHVVIDPAPEGAETGDDKTDVDPDTLADGQVKTEQPGVIFSDLSSFIESGLKALVQGVDSGGWAGKDKNQAYQQAKTNYENSGGKYFDQEVAKVMGGKSTLLTNPQVSGLTTTSGGKRQIQSGTFPGYGISGLGACLGDYDGGYLKTENGSIKGIEVPTEWAVGGSVDAETQKKLTSLSGKTPETGWMAMLSGEPYVYRNNSWRQITKEGSGTAYDELKKWMLRQLNPNMAFKTGGLADFTGPAWLDGTKSKPEIVLNQQDSANFLVLRDILSDILDGTSGLPKTNKKDGSGDNYYDIEINVESLNDDYDVEQLADKIRGMIYDDATYRNVNSINNIR